MADPRLLVAGDQVHFAYGGRQIFTGASFVIKENERVALVGPNGAGKTTFINLLLGKLKPEMGEVQVEPTLKYGYLTQQFEFAAVEPSARLGADGRRPSSAPDTTVGGLVTELPPQAKAIQEQLQKIEELMADPKFYEEPGYEDVLTRYGEMQREFQMMASKGDEQAALSFLQELGLPDVTLETKMKSLSGGQKTRVLLAKALANYKDMDLLILDEPTNHLDIETVEWLEDFLVNRYGNALLLVAHDQYLMDNLATKVLEIEDKKVWEWTGNYTDYLEQREAVQRAREARRRREAKEFQRQMAIIDEIKRRNRFDHQAQSKQTRLEKMKKDSEHVPQAQRTGFRLTLKSVQKSSNDVLFAEKLTKKFGDHAILDNTSFVIGKGDKVGLIGPNGCGKTTLLRMVVGTDKPTSGAIEVSPGVKIGFFDQEHAGLQPGRTLIDEVRSVKKMSEEDARAMLGRFLFKGDDAFKSVEKLSGGEKARMALLKFLAGETNFLVLDEPTNHLDLASQKVVEDALANYDGTLLVVSHDRHFLDAVVNKIGVVAHRKVGIFPGNFSETRTLTRLQEFMGTGEPEPFLVRKSFTDYDTGKRYTTGETVMVTGNETQTTKRLFRLAMERAWLEPKD